MKKAIIILTSTALYTLYLLYAYNSYQGNSYIYEPLYISLTSELPENTKPELVFKTVHDPSKPHKLQPLENDSIPENTHIFAIDSCHKIVNFSIYFLSLPAGENFQIDQLIASNTRQKDFIFSLKDHDLTVTENLIMNQVNDSTIGLTKIELERPVSSAISFDTRVTFTNISNRTSTKVPVKPSLFAYLVILILGFLWLLSLSPLFNQIHTKGISAGAFILGLAIFLMPTGEKVCNLLLVLATAAGILTIVRKGFFRVWLRENRVLILVSGLILLCYSVSYITSTHEYSSRPLLIIKFGLPLGLVAVSLNTWKSKEIKLQYISLLAGVITSVFLHFGWLVVLLDTVENRDAIISMPRYYLESDVFSRVHHSYLSAIYLMGLIVLFFSKDLFPIGKRQKVIISILIFIALVFAYSRAAVLSLIFIVIFIIIRRLRKWLNLEIVHFTRFSITSVLTIALILSVIIGFRVNSAPVDSAISGIDMRIALWQNAANIIRQKPLLGHGPGKYQSDLFQANELNIYNRNSGMKLNTHNQFLETSGMFGLIAGLGLIGFLLFPTGLTREGREYTSFIICTALIFIGVFLFESFLNRNLGVMIFGICYGLLGKFIAFIPAEVNAK